MPTYEYVCRSCGHLFEIVQSMRDETLTECPQCGGELRKVFAPPAISFKGSGFYATDHGKKKSKPASDKKADAGSGSGSGSESGSGSGSGSGSSETTSDAKPAAETKKDASSSTSAPAKDASGS
jgi:putative FmdB family regulatory protein